MKPVNSTFVFGHLNTNNAINKRVIDVMQHGVAIPPEKIQGAFFVINKNFKYPLKNSVLEAVQKGKIIMVLNKGRDIPPTCMPWFLASVGGHTKAVVVLDHIATNYDENTKSCEVDNPKKLYCLLESAYLGLACHMKPEICTNQGVVSEGSAMYADIFVKILNKEYALNVDKNRMNLVTFLASKFFLINMLGMKNSPKVDEYAYKNCVNPNKMIIDAISADFNDEVFEDISKFIQALAHHPETSKYLPGLTVRGYLQQFITTYKPAMLLALESLPYFLFNIDSVNMGAFFNNQQILEPICDKRAPKMFALIGR